MRERRKVRWFLMWVLDAASGLRGIPSIVEGVLQGVDFVVSFVFVEADLLVEHVAIELLFFYLFCADVLVFAERIHFIEK